MTARAANPSLSVFVCLRVQVYVSLADMATMRDALKKESLEVETKLAYVPVDGFVTQDDLVMLTLTQHS